MTGSQNALTKTFMSLIAQEASAEIILEVLVDEAALYFPSLQRPDLETIVLGVLQEACRLDAAVRTSENVVCFPLRAHAEQSRH